MQRISRNKAFLDDLLGTRGKRKQKAIITRATYDNLCALYELILNSPNLNYTKKDEKVIKKSKIVLKKFFKQKLDLSSFKILIHKHLNLLLPILCLVLQKLIQSDVCTILNNHNDI
jgi:arginyl-tRNA--protein-N-Asp/Glu arginylyltransferase